VPCNPEEADRLRRASELISTLNLQAEFTKETIARIERDQKETSEALHELVAKFAAVEVSVKTLEKNADERGGRRFSVWQGTLFVLLAAVLALAANVGLTYLKAYLDQKH
jgi:hypothetical protein